jgi:hypothetical protein
MSVHSFIRNIQIGDTEQDPTINVGQSLITAAANIIGTSYKGKAFVPEKIFSSNTVANSIVYNTKENILGTHRQNQHAHLYDDYVCYADSMAYDALSMWQDNGGVYSSFTRVLGIGTGTRGSNGKMLHSGFNAAEDISSGSLTQTKSGNIHSVTDADSKPGNVTFVLKKMLESSTRAASVDAANADPDTVDYLNELGNDNDLTLNSHYLSDVLIFASGNLPNLISNPGSDLFADHSSTAASSYTDQDSKQILNIQPYIKILGFKPKYDEKENNVFSLGTRPSANVIQKPIGYYNVSKNYISDKFLEKGHLTYTSYSLNGIEKPYPAKLYQTDILTVKPYSTLGANPTFPDYNSFESEFTTAKTPWITSQPFNRHGLSNNRKNIHEYVHKLFRFHALSDGESGNKYRIKINPTFRGKLDLHREPTENEYSTFDIYFFEYEPRNNTFIQLEYYKNINLSPKSDNYIGFKIGTIHKYYDFKSNKVVEKGLYENISKYLRVEIADDIEYMSLSNQNALLPSGFESYPHIKLQKSAFTSWYSNNNVIETIFDTNKVYHLPPMHALNYYPDFVTDTDDIENNWGIVFTQAAVKKHLVDSILKSSFLPKFTQSQIRDNRALVNRRQISPHYYYTKYFLSEITDSNHTHLNVLNNENNYLNSFFHLEKIAYKNTKTDGELDSPFNSLDDGKNARNMIYKHSGRPFANGVTYNYIDINNDVGGIWDEEGNLIQQFRNKLSFDFFTYGGFDGVDIRDSDKKFLRNDAIARELYTANIGEQKTTYSAYDKAIDIAMDESNCASDIVILPGIKEIPLIEKVVKKCEEDRNHFFIADTGGAASNNLIQFHKLVKNNDLNTISDSGDLVKTSLGISGKNTFVLNEFESADNNNDYTVDSVRIATNDERFSLGQDFNDSPVYYSYKKVLDKQYTRVLSNWNSLNITSRYLFPVFGDLNANISIGAFRYQKQIPAEAFVLGKIAQTITPRSSLTQTDLPLFYAGASFSLIDSINLKESSLEFENNAKLYLRKSSINLLYKPLNKDAINLLSEKTAHGERKSVFQVQSIVRTIQEIKKRIKFDIFINESFVKGGFLFTQNSNFQNLYQRLEIQLEFIMTSFLKAGYITNYIINIPNSKDDKTILDMQNYIIRGSIILQFDQSDTIELTLDSVLSDLSLMTNSGQDEVLLPKI